MSSTELQAFRLIGLKLGHKTSNQGGQSAIDCGRLWQQFEQEACIERIPGRSGNNIYAVYYDYEGDHSQPFGYFIGCQVSNNARVPAGMHELVVPAQQYKTIVAKGEIPHCIAETWQKIWLSAIPRAYRYDFEVYGERSRNWNDGEVEILLSVTVS